MKNKYALVSVFNKQGVVDFCKNLSNLDIRIISTGGTAKALRDANINIKEVSDITGFPEMLDGRVKTLHPIVHAGILARRDNKDHVASLKKYHVNTIDFVVCNLYPFEKTIEKPNVSIEEVIENIDIGGPTLIRAAAKNYKDVIVLTNPDQYDTIISMLKNRRGVDVEVRKHLALQAYCHTAQYDSIISTYLRKRWKDTILPDDLTISMRKKQEMRYGENPHQKAIFYKGLPPISEPGISTADQLHGKALSFNNILDSDCAIECIKEFTKPSCVIVKHATPCGIASSTNLLQAWKDAFATDVYSPFGGIVAFNREVYEEVAEELKEFFLEVIIAPGFTAGALQMFQKKKNLRLLSLAGIEKEIKRQGLTYRSVVGGFLVQERDYFFNERKNWKIVTQKKPSSDELDSMEFAVRCVKHVKSNAVLFAKGMRTVAIGGGQTSRVDAAWIATHKGKEQIVDSIMASDAFFPFRDAVDVAAQAGVKGIIQPGGSVRDDEVIDAANQHGIAMVFSGQRYFRH
ncbi:MAG: bifunctional phosphoribosylaminoimidazolecarboxamide formyltransferase/IMP cyclohydrolase [Thermoplasmatota archaeon]